MPDDRRGAGEALRILIAFDKFRGSLTAREANDAAARAVEAAVGARVATLPLADGGEGTLDALAAPGSERRTIAGSGPYGGEARLAYRLDPDRGEAVVELAALAGHEAAAAAGYDPDRASSHGCGEVLADAAAAGARRVVVALGGSITMDAGAGLLEPFGARYFDDAGAPVERPAGRRLAEVARIDLSGFSAPDFAITVAADVTNVLGGPQGAAAVFGPQKGVTDVEVTDAALRGFDERLAHALGREPVGGREAAGAAGGTLVGLCALGEVSVRDGFALVAERHGLDDALRRADLVITGEGSLDAQSLAGKGPIALARAAREAGLPVIALCGRLALTPDDLAQNGVTAAFSIAQGPATLEEALVRAADDVAATAAQAVRLFASGG